MSESKMTSMQELRNDAMAERVASDPYQSQPSIVLSAPSYTLSEESRNPQVFNKENLEDEAANTLPNVPSMTNGPPVRKNASVGCSALQNGGASSSFPMHPPPPTMNFSSSIAFSDTTFPFSSLVSSKSFDRNGQQLTYSQMTELLQYTSASGNALYGISPTIFDTPMHDAASVVADADQLRRNTEWQNDCDVTMAANALLGLTPSMIHKTLEGAPADKPPLTPSQRRRSITAELDDWRRRWVETPICHVAPASSTKYKSKLHVVLRAQELLEENVPYTLHACRCKNSHCLKLYCNCFQSGTFCDPLICVCRGCENSAEHSVPRGSRTRAIYEILNRRMNAFDPKEKKKEGQGCSCKKNRYVLVMFL
jgi:Tesmin/TSO1-like CXC domain, cysteine-rich domain